MSKITDDTIRAHLGHSSPECCVVIARNGTIWRFGSPDLTDRSKDFWTVVGTRAEIAAEIANTEKQK